MRKETILDEVVENLLNRKHSVKWKKRKLNAKKFFEDILADAKTINKELTSDELDMISDLYTKHIGGKMKF